MDDRSTTAASPEVEEADGGVVEELLDALGTLDAGADHEPAAALAAAAAQFRADVSELHTESTGAAVVAVGPHVVALARGERIEVGRTGPLAVDHPLVSRRHVAIEHGPEGLRAIDLRSANGTWLVRGGDRVAVDDGGFVLRPGDRVETAEGIELCRIEVAP